MIKPGTLLSSIFYRYSLYLGDNQIVHYYETDGKTEVKYISNDELKVWFTVYTDIFSE